MLFRPQLRIRSDTDACLLKYLHHKSNAREHISDYKNIAGKIQKMRSSGMGSKIRVQNYSSELNWKFQSGTSEVSLARLYLLVALSTADGSMIDFLNGKPKPIERKSFKRLIKIFGKNENFGAFF